MAPEPFRFRIYGSGASEAPGANKAPELKKFFELRSQFGSGAMAPELVQLRKKILHGSGAKVAPEPDIFPAPEL